MNVNEIAAIVVAIIFVLFVCVVYMHMQIEKAMIEEDMTQKKPKSKCCGKCGNSLSPKPIKISGRQELLDKLITCMDLKFVEANEKKDMANGYYVWRNSKNWPINSYEIVKIMEGKMYEVETSDDEGIVWEVDIVEPYGQLAGPILKI